MKVLALSGSLRAASLNSALLRTVAKLAPPAMEVRVRPLAGELPLFNPDYEGQALPAAVQSLHAEVAAADALLIASPEYAHGVTGAIKNLLGWLVSFEPFVNKPVAVINTSPRAHHADEALRETLRTMNAGLVGGASFLVPLLGSGVAESAMAEAPFVKVALQTLFAELLRTLPQSPPLPSAFPID